jgi:anti-anti-sigma factor
MESYVLNKSTGVITIDGILNDEVEDVLKNASTKFFQQGIKNIILDFRPLDHMNSSGVSVLIKLTVLAKQRKLRLFAFGLNDRYLEIFKLTGLSKGITIFHDKSDKRSPLSDTEISQFKGMTIDQGEQNDNGWTPYLSRLQVKEKSEGALNKNVDGRQVIGPLQGFGPMWQKTYLLTINKPELKLNEVITAMKKHFPEFQPAQNTFYPSNNGIAAGEIVLIDSLTPGGIVSTGVLVLYADDLSFTLMTPQGHPEAGWVTFSAKKQGNTVVMQIQGLARAADPVYEFAFRIAGSKFQETIWKHVLSSLASHLGIESDVQMMKTCVASDLQWGKANNIWYNAQIRSLPYNISRLFSRSRRKAQ